MISSCVSSINNKKTNVGFTDAAIAGLAAKEDFSAIKLKRSDSQIHSSLSEYLPYNELMLIQIKGRRYCQSRLVEPCIDSLNNNDCFILVSSNRLYLYIGEYANIIEKSKANEIYEWIRLRKDLGIHKTQTRSHIIADSKSIAHLINKENNNINNTTVDLTPIENEFFNLLNTDTDNTNKSTSFVEKIFQMPDEDEKYEMLINETNMVYKVDLNTKATNSKLNDLNLNTSTSEDLSSSSMSSSSSSSDEQEETITTMPNNEISNYCLEPLSKHSGQLLSYSMLDENCVFVFDFGTELYVWSGRNSLNKTKKAGLLLAKNLYESGFDYKDCTLSPFNPAINLSIQIKRADLKDKYFKCVNNRPKWTIFGKQFQNIETVLFREKFIDWPLPQQQPQSPSINKINTPKTPLSSSRPSIKSNTTPNCFLPVSTSFSSPSSNQDLFNYEPIQADILLNTIINQPKDNNSNVVNLVLENSSLGRGRHWYDETEHRSFDILTESVSINKIIESQMVECCPSEFGEFSSNYTYVIKWKYKINAVGFRNLKGEISQRRNGVITGRDRFALFFWQGNMSSINEKGTSALLSLDLASLVSSNQESNNALTNETNENKKSNTPHVHVFQYQEPAAFCQLFDGQMIILSNENEINDDRSMGWRMFELRGELKEESHLIEMNNVLLENLRSKTSFLFTNQKQKLFIIWHGCYSSNLQRSLIFECAQNLAKRESKRFQFGTVDFEIKEVEESNDFKTEFACLRAIFKSLNESDLDYNDVRSSYYSLLNITSNQAFNFTTRLFLMTSLFGQFEMKEILNPLRTNDIVCPYPFHQFQLYQEKQPSLFMIDNNDEIYIWQGWFESNTRDPTNKTKSPVLDTSDGSAKIRYTISRKCAYQTAINYWNAKYPNGQKFKGYIVYAGLEPIEFTSLFPAWKINENARNCNLNDGKVLNQKDNIQDVLTQLNRDRYPLEVLRKRPLPDGVNPMKLEYYLNDQEFEEILHLTKEEFFSLPNWKQTNLKKKAHLF